MQKRKDLVYKPNQTIMISNGEISLTQRKAYNVILQKAWNELKINKDQTSFQYNISELKEKAGIKATDNKRLKTDIARLKNIDVENVKENGDWSIFSLISSARKRNDVLEVELPIQVREALIDNTYYTTLDLLILKGLERKYSVILYEMAIRYNKRQIPEMTIEEFRALTGTDKKKSYNDFGLIRQKILTPALEEINSNKTDILLDYKTTNRGKKTLTIKFTVKPKPNKEFISAAAEISATSERVSICEAIEVETKKEIIRILKPLGVDFKIIQEFDINIELLKKQVETINGNIRDVRNVPGLLRYSVEKNLQPNEILQAIKSSKKRSNRDLEEREYSDDFYDSFFTNKK